MSSELYCCLFTSNVIKQLVYATTFILKTTTMWTNIVSPVLELFQTQTKFKYMDVKNNHFLTRRQTPLMVVPLLGGNEKEF